MLLNISVFAWYGAVAPWADFRVNNVIPLWRLILLGVLILLCRRIPMILLFWKKLKEIKDWQQALFVGFFGPIGVSAVFYLYVTLDFLNQVLVDGIIREDAARLQEVVHVVVWFLAITSIVVHGLSVPMGKFGYHMPRTLSQALSSENTNTNGLRRLQGANLRLRHRRDPTRTPPTETFALSERANEEPNRPVRIIAGSEETINQNGSPAQQSMAEEGQAHLNPLFAVDRADTMKVTRKAL